jgi:hypothetical protein
MRATQHRTVYVRVVRERGVRSVGVVTLANGKILWTTDGYRAHREALAAAIGWADIHRYTIRVKV